jgi:hypothetical protein
MTHGSGEVRNGDHRTWRSFAERFQRHVSRAGLPIVVILSAALTFTLLMLYFFGRSPRTYEVVLVILFAAVAVAVCWPRTIAKKVSMLVSIAAYGVAIAWCILLSIAIFGILFIYGPIEPRYLLYAPFLQLFGGPMSSLLVISALRRFERTLVSRYKALILVLCLFQIYSAAIIAH